MSSLSTSRPDFSETFLLRMRDPDFFSSWWKWTSWSRTAVWAFTGTLTSPKLIVPRQTGRAMRNGVPVSPPGQSSRPSSARRDDAAAVGIRGGFGAVAATRLAQDRSNVVGDGVLTDVQPQADLAVREPCGDAAQDLDFARRQPGGPRHDVGARQRAGGGHPPSPTDADPSGQRGTPAAELDRPFDLAPGRRHV